MKAGRAYFTSWKAAYPFLEVLRQQLDKGRLDYEGEFLKSGGYRIQWWPL